MSINDLAVPSGTAAYYSTGFRTVLESHIPYLIANGTTLKDVSSVLDVRYRYDFHGLLKAMNVPRAHWWITTRLNDYHRSDEYLGGISAILVVNETAIKTLMSTYLSNA